MKKIISGMLALMLFAGATQAQTTDKKQHGGKQDHAMMATKLGLSEDQKTKLKSIHEAQRAEMESLKTSVLTGEALAAKKKEIHEKYRAQSASVFTADQKAQLEKMKMERKENAKQRKGKGGKDFGAKGRHEAFANLNLSQDQKDQMARMRADSKTQFEALRNDKSLTDEQRKAKMKTLMDAQRDKMKSVLTKEQLAQLETDKATRKEKRGKQ